MSRLIDYDPLTGEASYFRWNSDGTFSIDYVQDVGMALEANKRQQIEANHKLQMKKDWVRYASIPNVVVMKWKNELGVDVFNKDHAKKVFQLLNSGDYKFLKTTEINHVPRY